MLKLYRRRPEIIEVIKWTASNWNEVKEWLDLCDKGYIHDDVLHIQDSRLSSHFFTVHEGEYIARNAGGHFFSISERELDAYYEETSR